MAIGLYLKCNWCNETLSDYEIDVMVEIEKIFGRNLNNYDLSCNNCQLVEKEWLFEQERIEISDRDTWSDGESHIKWFMNRIG